MPKKLGRKKKPKKNVGEENASLHTKCIHYIHTQPGRGEIIAHKKKKSGAQSSEWGKKRRKKRRAQMSYIEGREMTKENAEHRQKGETYLNVTTVLE